MNQEQDYRLAPPHWGYPGDPGYIGYESEEDIFGTPKPSDIDPEVQELLGPVGWEEEYRRVSRLPASEDDDIPPTILVPASQPALIDVTTPPSQVMCEPPPEPSRPTPPGRREPRLSMSPPSPRTATLLGVKQTSRFRPHTMSRAPQRDHEKIDFGRLLESFNDRARPLEQQIDEVTRKSVIRNALLYAQDTQPEMDRPRSGVDSLSYLDLIIRICTRTPDGAGALLQTIDPKHEAMRDVIRRVQKRWVIERHLLDQLTQHPSS